MAAGRSDRRSTSMMTDDLGARLDVALGPTYTIERELGGGGMSRVFLAEDVRLGRRVVVKLLSPELGAGVSADRFEREMRLAARRQHPHIVPLLTAGDVGGLPYYTMPFVAGASLRERLQAGPMSTHDAHGILRDVARALAYAHKQGIVHRDIKRRTSSSARARRWWPISAWRARSVRPRHCPPARRSRSS